jgi:hypothetical protein
MQIAANKESQRAPNEVVYYGQYSEDPYKINITRMDSEGGWIASSTQLVQFLNHVAGAPGIPALLKPATIQAMTTPAPAYPQGPARYAPRLDGSRQRSRDLVAQRQPPRFHHDHGPHGNGHVLGRPHQHPNPTLQRNRHRPRSNDVEHGADRPSLGRLRITGC